MTMIEEYLCLENRAKIDDFIAILGPINRANRGDFGEMG